MKDRHETRRITIEYDVKVKLNAATPPRPRMGESRTKEEEERFIIQTLRRELQRTRRA
jgi:hypothetical protein